MTNLSLLVQHSLVYGAVLGSLMCVIFMALALVNPGIWLKDYPPDIQQKHGPMSAKALRQRKLAGVPVLALLLGTLIVALVQLAQAQGTRLSLVDAFACVFLIFFIFNVVDLLILDGLIFVTIQPRLIILPGTEGAAGYKDYGFHLRASLKGVIGSAIASAVIAAIAVGVQALLG